MTATTVDFKALRKSIERFEALLRETRLEIFSLTVERHRLMLLPLPREDYAAYAAERIDIERESYIANINGLFQKSPPWNSRFWQFTPDSPKAYGERVNIAKASRTSVTGTRPDVPVENLFWFIGDIIKAGVQEAILDPRIDWPEDVGPPRAERQPMIAKLDARLAELRAQQDEMLSTAAENGFAVSVALPLDEMREQLRKLRRTMEFPDWEDLCQSIGLDPASRDYAPEG